jgi:hypothetical protein
MTHHSPRTWRAGTGHPLLAFNALWSGERHGFGWGRGRLGAAMAVWASKAGVAGERRGTHSNRGRLGAAMHCAPPKLCGSGALVAKSVSLPNAWMLLYAGAVAWLHLFLGAHSFTRCRTSYPTLPHFPVFTNLMPPSDIFEVKV